MTPKLYIDEAESALDSGFTEIVDVEADDVPTAVRNRPVWPVCEDGPVENFPSRRAWANYLPFWDDIAAPVQNHESRFSGPRIEDEYSI